MLAVGRRSLDRQEYDLAILALEHGRTLTRGLPLTVGLRRAIEARWIAARRAKAARDLGALADRLRALYGVDPRPSGVSREKRASRPVSDTPHSEASSPFRSRRRSAG